LARRDYAGRHAWRLMYNDGLPMWEEEFQRELEAAITARAGGNEGRARVCARRAAGVAARAYFAQRGVPIRGRSAQDVLLRLSSDLALSAEIRENARLLTLRVNEDFGLPPGIDLVACARALATALAGRLIGVDRPPDPTR